MKPGRRARWGQIETPEALARLMVGWACSGRAVAAFLDPAAGRGVFLRAYLSLPGAKTGQAAGFEIDPALCAAPGLPLQGGDYLKTEAGPFDAVAANPPFIKHRPGARRQGLVRRLAAAFGEEFSPALNAYCLFLLKSLRELKPGGRLAYLVPAELLSSDLGVPVKRALVRSGLLRSVLCFDHSLRLFPGALTTAAILLCENSPSPGRVEFCWITRLSALEAAFTGTKVPGLRRLSVPLKTLDPGKKWQNGDVAAGEAGGEDLLPLSAYGRCLRGIATGANAFFTLSANELARHGLNRRHVSRCVTRAPQAGAPAFTDADFSRLSRGGAKCFLLDLGGKLDPAALRYLESGRSKGVHRRYLPSRRKPWYAREKRAPADLWIPVFFRKAWRVTRNEARVLQLTSFHGFFLNALGRRHEGRLVRHLNSPAFRRQVEAQARRYGGGLSKLEPGDVARLRVPDFNRP